MAQRLGKIQKALVQWITESGYAYIGAGTTAHQRYGLGGRDLEEIDRSLDALVARGIIKRWKPNFYSLPDYEKETLK